MKERIISILKHLPYIRGLHNENKSLRKKLFFPPGHFYSPIVNSEEIKQKEREIWRNRNKRDIDLIAINWENQLKLLKEFNAFYFQIPFQDEKQKGRRYYFKNKFYSYTDAIILYSFIRYYKPQKIIEVGSGFSSALMLDVNEEFFQNEIELTFIDPHPERLYSLLNPGDKDFSVIANQVQLIDPSHFKRLEAGDILFIDSSHVSKTGSDLNFILFEILPVLKSGVLIHFHDIFYPFEYPEEWVYEGRSWNEIYLIKAFLMCNSEFEILFFSHYLHTHFPRAFDSMPLCYNNPGGNLWIKKK